jgi:hypothetical protein
VCEVIIEKKQITAECSDIARIRNSVTCGESVQFPWGSTAKQLSLHLSQVMALPSIPYRYEFDQGSGLCTVYPRT